MSQSPLKSYIRVSVQVSQIPQTPDYLTQKTKENNKTLEKLLQENKDLEEKCRQLAAKQEALELQAEELKAGCVRKLHSMECPRMKKLKKVCEESLVLYKAIKERARLNGYSYDWM